MYNTYMLSVCMWVVELLNILHYNSSVMTWQTVDPKFDDLEQKVVSMYTLVHRLVYNIAAWQDKLQV